jgi:putative aminopeptidase FrvX
MLSYNNIDTDHLINILVELLKIPSPTGYTGKAISYIQNILEEYDDLKVSLTQKGALTAEWPGDHQNSPRALTAHIDTLGAMVKEIKSNGRLRLTNIGSFAWNTVEGEGCTVFTQSGDSIRGSYLLDKSSSHVHSDRVTKLRRKSSNLEVRLDILTSSAEETHATGIRVGDFVCFDPRVEMTNGFIRSRHLDDKTGIACILTAVNALNDAALKPTQTTILHFSNYEEVGHGAAAGIPPSVRELVAVDMAAVGEGQNSDEFHATLCVKDSGGPYHYGINQRLRKLAEEHQIAFKIDIYPYYGSDGEAYWRAGGDVAVGLIGPGVDASHNYERTHIDALIATTQWICAYLLSE